jgi:hypothetical protein
MKNHSVHLRFSLQFGLCLAAFLPLPSHAGMEVPYWLYPEWIAAKVMDFHARNTERIELAQAQAHVKNSTTGVTTGAGVANAASTPNANTNTALVNDPNQRKANLAPVETANVKVNEKHLSKEELMELRKQLRQK